MEEHNILTDAKHGFRCKRSCETQLIATIQELVRGLSEGKQLDVILLDFAKVFGEFLISASYTNSIITESEAKPATESNTS